MATPYFIGQSFVYCGKTTLTIGLCPDVTALPLFFLPLVCFDVRDPFPIGLNDRRDPFDFYTDFSQWFPGQTGWFSLNDSTSQKIVRP